MSYHDTIQDVYRKAAAAPSGSLCCVPQTPKYLPGLNIPRIMHEMNYGCGTTIHLQDMKEGQTILYVGVGGGLEALQLAYFARRPGGVIAVEPIAEMREAARRNFETAAERNEWFDPSFVDIRDGDALDLPIEDDSVDLAAQNCLFNIFQTAEDSGHEQAGTARPATEREQGRSPTAAGAPPASPVTSRGVTARSGGDLERALSEMHRVLKPAGRLVMSDPIAPCALPEHLQKDHLLRAMCISGCLTCDRYMSKIVDAGFGSIEVRARRPYRMLDRQRFGLDDHVLLESLEVCAYKTPVPQDGPCIFTGRVVIYTGESETFDDGKGHVLTRDLPLPVCDKTAAALAALGREDLTVTESTWHYAGGGCC